MQQVVLSPAGEKVTVLTDTEWRELTDTDVRSLMWSKARAAILGALWHHGKVVDRPSGRASRKLITLAQQHGYVPDTATAYLSVVNAPAMGPALERELKGKRTFRIQLVALPESWFHRLQPSVVEPVVQAELGEPAEPVAEVEPPASVDAVDEPASLSLVDVYQPPVEPDALELQVSMAVARSLLTQVVEIIAAGPEIREVNTERVDELERDLRMAHQRLSSRLEENDKLRRRCRVLEDELAAAHTERDGLRGRLKAAEYNLEKAMSADNQRFIMAEVHREVDKMMRAKPASDKGAA